MFATILTVFRNGQTQGFGRFIHLELWYNTSRHSSTRTMSFELVYGCSPPVLFHCEENPLDDVDEALILTTKFEQGSGNNEEED